MPLSEWIRDPTLPGVLEEPFSYDNFAGRTYNEWINDTRKVAGCDADWQKLMEVVNKKNRHTVRRLAISHWSTTEDIRWIEQNLPCLEELDVSDVMDGAPEDAWTWDIFVQVCPKLLARLTKLTVRNWTDTSYHAGTITELRDPHNGDQESLVRRRGRAAPAVHGGGLTLGGFTGPKMVGNYRCDDGGSVVATVLRACSNNLKTLAVRGDYRRESFSIGEVDAERAHAWLCGFSDRISEWAPKSLECVVLHQTLPSLSNLILELKASGKLPNLKTVSVDFDRWLSVFHGLNRPSWNVRRWEPREHGALLEYDEYNYHSYMDQETGQLFEGEWWELYCSRRALHAEIGRELETSSTDTMGRLLWELHRASRSVNIVSHGSVVQLNDMRLDFEAFWNITHPHDSFEPLCAGPRCALEELGGAPTGPELLRWAISTFDWAPKFNWTSFTRDQLDAATAEQMVTAATLLEELGQDVVDDLPPSPRLKDMLVQNVAMLESVELRQRQREQAAREAELEWEREVARAAARAAARARRVQQPIERRVTRSMTGEAKLANLRITRSMTAHQRPQRPTSSNVANNRVGKSKTTKGKAVKKPKGKTASKTRGKSARK